MEVHMRRNNANSEGEASGLEMYERINLSLLVTTTFFRMDIYFQANPSFRYKEMTIWTTSLKPKDNFILAHDRSQTPAHGTQKQLNGSSRTKIQTQII